MGVLVTGVGGTGVVTIGALLGMAACQLLWLAAVGHMGIGMAALHILNPNLDALAQTQEREKLKQKEQKKKIQIMFRMIYISISLIIII
mgnify:CR=1 FL=1